ncbi:MAG: HAMP domain-containing histidine kinase [Xanthobacteraceae bacterium]|nr:HAMP domain-containing histidine kinase [Xanthobacteraceae bacterium]
MNHQPNRTLAQLLAIRMSLVAVGVSFALMALTTLYYTLDTPQLRRLTLELQVHHIIDAIRRGDDPATWTLYKTYPGSYGFRVFDHRRASERKLITEANAGLLTSLGTDSGSSGNSAGKDLVSGLSSVTSGDINGDGEPDNIWLLTSRGEIGDQFYWVQVAMVDDPAWQWKAVLGTELFNHVVVPILFIVPALMLAVYLATRRALKPLSRIARQADELSGAVASGRPFALLSGGGLPLEFDGVVTGINAMIGKLDRSLSLQKEFTSDVAHQLRTPLAVLLLEVSALPPGDALNHVKRELGDLADLVNQLLRFAQAEDAMVHQRHAVDIAETARKVCEDLAGAAFGAGKQIEFDAPDEGVFVSGQPALIDTAIRNIVDNAIKLSPRRSTIFVRVDAERNIIVEDCGPGVPDAQKELIFKRFWRADGRRVSGSGIGLTLVRRIAFLHGGDVRVEDRPGGGARFVVTLGPTAAN